VDVKSKVKQLQFESQSVTRRKVFKGIVATLLMAALCPAGQALAQTYPSKPIKIIVPAGPGGPTDLVARPLAERLSAALGQQALIENRAGAGGNIGAEAVARAEPDGYTLLLTANGPLVLNEHIYGKIPFDPEKDFTPISLLASVPAVLLVSATLPVNSLEELIKLAKSQPGKLNYASVGYGTGPHLAGEMFKLRTGVDILHVPYKGASQVYPALLTGEAQIYFDGANGLPYTKGGKIKPLAVLTPNRIASAPQLPTMAEGGAPGVEHAGWYSLLAPAGTPRAIVDTLQRESARILKDPAVGGLLTGQHFEIVASTPEQLTARIRTDRARYGQVIKAAGIKVQ
jgi:tripartite-type tricarboxylate transporter receptor subunit TctC